MEKLILDLYKIGAIKFGKFTFVSGLVSPNYIDLRILATYPLILKQIAELMYKKIEKAEYDFLAPVPYTAIPIACAISLEHNIPMLLIRKEAHKSGTKNLIEGKFKKEQRAIMIDDVITTGNSKLKFIKILEECGLKVGTVLTFIDRNQGGAKQVKEAGYNFCKVFDLTRVFQILSRQGILQKKELEKNLLWLKNNSI